MGLLEGKHISLLRFPHFRLIFLLLYVVCSRGKVDSLLDMIAKARSALDGVPVSAEEMSKTKAIVQSLLSGPSTMTAKPGISNDAYSLPINGPGQRRLVLVQEETGGCGDDDEEEDGTEVPSHVPSHAYTPVDTIDATASKAPITSTLDEWSRSVIKLGPAPVLTDLGLDPIHTTLKSFPISSLALQKSSSASTIGSPSAYNSVESSPRAPPDYSGTEALDLSNALRDSGVYSEASAPSPHSDTPAERDVSPSSPRTAAVVASAASSTQPLQFNIIDHVTKLASSSLDAADLGDTDAYTAEEAGRPEKPPPPTIETYEPSPRPNNAINRRSMYHSNPTMAQEDGGAVADYSALLKSATAALDRSSYDRNSFDSESDVGDDIHESKMVDGRLEVNDDDYHADFIVADEQSDGGDDDGKKDERDHRNIRHKMKASVSFNNIDSFGPDEPSSEPPDEPAHAPLTLSSRTLSQNVLASPPRPTFNPPSSLRNMTTHNPTEAVTTPLPIVEDTHHHHHHSDTKHKHTPHTHHTHTHHTHTHNHTHGSKSPILYSPRNRDSFSSSHTNDADISNNNHNAINSSSNSIVEPDDIESLQVKQSIAEQMSLLDAMITGSSTDGATHTEE